MPWMCICWVIHYFVEPDLLLLITGRKLTSERWQNHYFIFTQRLVGLLVKSVDFSNLCCVMCQWRQGKGTCVFSQSFHACTSISIKNILISWFLTSFSFSILIFTALWYRICTEKLYTFVIVKNQMWVTLHTADTFFLLTLFFFLSGFFDE